MFATRRSASPVLQAPPLPWSSGIMSKAPPVWPPYPDAPPKAVKKTKASAAGRKWDEMTPRSEAKKLQRAATTQPTLQHTATRQWIKLDPVRASQSSTNTHSLLSEAVGLISFMTLYFLATQISINSRVEHIRTCSPWDGWSMYLRLPERVRLGDACEGKYAPSTGVLATSCHCCAGKASAKGNVRLQCIAIFAAEASSSPRVNCHLPGLACCLFF